jgi:ssRNA-specific RNase YbeY (16S rRNA maturation enzyme)
MKKEDMCQYNVFKRIKPVDSIVDVCGDLFMLIEFCFQVDDNKEMLYIIHQYNGIDRPGGILSFALKEEKFQESFELYKTFSEVQKEYYKNCEKNNICCVCGNKL